MAGQLRVCERLRVRRVGKEYDAHSLSGIGCRHTSTNSGTKSHTARPTVSGGRGVLASHSATCSAHATYSTKSQRAQRRVRPSSAPWSRVQTRAGINEAASFGRLVVVRRSLQGTVSRQMRSEAVRMACSRWGGERASACPWNPNLWLRSGLLPAHGRRVAEERK